MSLVSTQLDLIFLLLRPCLLMSGGHNHHIDDDYDDDDDMMMMIMMTMMISMGKTYDEDDSAISYSCRTTHASSCQVVNMTIIMMYDNDDEEDIS